MDYIKKAHEEAQSAGYVTGFRYDRLAAIDPLGAMEVMWMDPRWWQAYGKARGWSKGFIGSPASEKENPALANVWKLNAHRLIDHLASKKDANSFFKQFYD